MVLGGAAIVLAGVLLLVAARVPFPGHVPGDLSFRRDGFSLSVPPATSLPVSVLLTVIADVIVRLPNR